MRRSPLAALAALLLLALLPAAAPAQTPVNSISNTGGNAVFYNGGAESSDVTITVDASAITLTDTAAELDPGDGCTVDESTPHTATCALPPETYVAAVITNLGAGDDQLEVGSVSGPQFTLQADGGDDDDTITAGPGADRLFGGEGDDTLSTGAGADTIDGGPGADEMDGGAHPEMGRDEVSYATRAEPVFVDLGEGRGAGESDGAGDTLSGFEWASGGSGDDHLIGSDGDEALDGAAGEDELEGRGGTDVLRGDRDLSSTARFADDLDGGDGMDLLMGGPGPDALDGGGDRDEVSYADHEPTAFGQDVTAAHAVTVDLSDPGTDGGPMDEAEGDTEDVRDTLVGIEDVSGGPGDDTLTGDEGINRLNGGRPSSMDLDNRGGDDTLAGGGGPDTLDGGAFGEPMNGDGVDTFGGGAGPDTLDSRDNIEDASIDCGADIDTVLADVNDPAPTSCEGDGGPGGPGPGDPGAPGEVRMTTTGGSPVPSLSYLSRNGVANRVTVTNVTTTTPRKLVLEDTGTGASITAGTGCELVSGKVECAYPGEYVGAILLTLGDGNDEATVDVGSMSTGGFLSGGTGDDALAFTGQHALMTLDGGPGDDTLTGGPGDETLNGGAGADTMTGAGGSDTVSYLDGRSGDTGVVVNLADAGTDGGTDDIADEGNGPTDAKDVLSGVENVTGTLVNDALTGNDQPNRIVGLDGQDVITGGAGDDDLDGGLGFHAPFSTDDNPIDQVFGGPGNDRMAGGRGNDQLDGDTGSDTVTYNEPFRAAGVHVDLSPDATQAAQQGGAEDQDPDAPGFKGDILEDVENLEGSGHADGLFGDDGANTIAGGAGVDQIAGGGGPDVLEGGNDTAADELYGEGGNDTLVSGNALTWNGVTYVYGHDGGDNLAGGPGTDTASYARALDGVVVTAGAGDDDDGRAGEGDTVGADVENLVGGHAADTLTALAGDVDSRLDGGPGSDTLHAGAGDDRLNGGAGIPDHIPSGDDTLDAGPGDDILVGGEGGTAPNGDGADTFTAGTGADQINALDGRADTVTCAGGDDTAFLDPADGTGCASTDEGAPPQTATGTAAPGQTVSTDDGQPGTTGAETGVQTPVAGTITIDQTPKVTFTAPGSDVELLPLEVQIEAPASTAGAPLRIRFTIDAGLLPADVDVSRLVIYRDGVAVQACAGGAAATVADPDPCHLPPVKLAGGDVEVVVLSAHASRWNLGLTAVEDDGGNNGNNGNNNNNNNGGGSSDTGTTTPVQGTVAAPLTVPGPSLLPPAGGRRDTTPPRVTLSAGRSVKASALASKGVTASLRCTENASVTATLTLDAKTARKAKIKGALGTAKTTCAAGRSAGLRVRIASKHRGKVRKLRSGKLTLALVSTDVAGNRATTKGSISVKR